MKLKKIMKLKPFVCDQCGCSMVHGREIIVNDLEWKRLVELSKSKDDPKHTLLCPECIEALNGGPLEIKQLIIEKKGGYKIFFPMNIWYARKNNIEVPLRYILGHYRYFERIGGERFRSSFRKLWEECKSREFK